MSHVLSHLSVVEGSAFIAAPFAGMTLAQLGAEVIRFDPLEGGIDHHRWPVTAEGKSLYWAGMNKAKKSVALDLKRPEGQELAAALIGRVGNFVTNFPARGWLAYDKLQAQREDLVMVAIQGNADGSTALDFTVHAGTGFASLTGPVEDTEPQNQTVPAWDFSTGLHAALALLAADGWRQRTGQGQCVQVALSDVAFAALAHMGFVGEVLVNGQERPRLGNAIYGAFGRDFVAADGARFMVAAISLGQWKSLLQATELGAAVAGIEAALKLDFSLEGQRFEHRATLFALFDTWFAQHGAAQVEAAFDAQGVCYGRYQGLREAVSSDWRIHRNPMFEVLQQPGIGRYPMPGSPLRFGAGDRKSAAAAPQLGQHTAEVLQQHLGLTQAQVGELQRRGLVGLAEHAR